MNSAKASAHLTVVNASSGYSRMTSLWRHWKVKTTLKNVPEGLSNKWLPCRRFRRDETMDNELDSIKEWKPFETGRAFSRLHYELFMNQTLRNMDKDGEPFTSSIITFSSSRESSAFASRLCSWTALELHWIGTNIKSICLQEYRPSWLRQISPSLYRRITG